MTGAYVFPVIWKESCRVANKCSPRRQLHRPGRSLLVFSSHLSPPSPTTRQPWSVGGMRRPLHSGPFLHRMLPFSALAPTCTFLLLHSVSRAERAAFRWHFVLTLREVELRLVLGQLVWSIPHVRHKADASRFHTHQRHADTILRCPILPAGRLHHIVREHRVSADP